MRRRVGVGEGNDRGDTAGEFVVRAVLGGFSGEDEGANLGAAGAEDNGVSNVRGGTEGELDRDGVRFLAVDLFCLEGVNWGWEGDGEGTYHDEGIVYPTNVLVRIGDCRMFDEEVFGRIRPVWLVRHDLLDAQHARRRECMRKTCLGVPSVQDVELIDVTATGLEAHIFVYAGVHVGTLCANPVPCLVGVEIAEGRHELTHLS